MPRKRSSAHLAIRASRAPVLPLIQNIPTTIVQKSLSALYDTAPVVEESGLIQWNVPALIFGTSKRPLLQLSPDLCRPPPPISKLGACSSAIGMADRDTEMLQEFRNLTLIPQHTRMRDPPVARAFTLAYGMIRPRLQNEFIQSCSVRHTTPAQGMSLPSIYPMSGRLHSIPQVATPHRFRPSLPPQAAKKSEASCRGRLSGCRACTLRSDGAPVQLSDGEVQTLCDLHPRRPQSPFHHPP